MPHVSLPHLYINTKNIRLIFIKFFFILDYCLPSLYVSKTLNDMYNLKFLIGRRVFRRRRKSIRLYKYIPHVNLYHIFTVLFPKTL